MAVEIGHLTVDVSMEPNVQKLIAEHAALTAELNELASSSGSDHIAAKYWKQRQDARNELCTAKDERDAAKWERDAALAVIEQVRAVVDNERIPDEVHGDDWIRAEHFQPILAQSPASAIAKVKADARCEALEEAATIAESVTEGWHPSQSIPKAVSRNAALLIRRAARIEPTDG